MNYCDHCQWETNEECFCVGGDMWCEPCVVKALPDEMENLCSILADFIPESVWERELEIAA